ncbi:MAG: 50S ribosomal protein L6 [Chloroflexota bacterium]
MSRIGNQPVAIPDKVKVDVKGSQVTVNGPKGKLEMNAHYDMAVEVEDGNIVVKRPTDQKQHKALHGLTRALIANMVTGVSEGFRITLEIEGVGYQAQLQGNNLNMKLGFSHEVIVEPPAGSEIKFDVPKESRGRVIHIDGIDKQTVGQVAANIRSLRPPEPYKGKGIRYQGEQITRKAGKAGKK